MAQPYVYHTDPSHGWLAVKRQELKDLGVFDKISSYSYQKGQTVYLEEDCDMSLFIAAKKGGRSWYKIPIRQSHTGRDVNRRHRIRGYESFSPLVYRP